MEDESAEDFLNRATHALVAVSVHEIKTNASNQHLLHIVAYTSQPTDEDVKDLYEELFTDEELEMTHLVPREDYMLLEYPWDFIKSVMEKNNLN
jgi:hypothetical protein